MKEGHTIDSALGHAAPVGGCVGGGRTHAREVQWLASGAGGCATAVLVAALLGREVGSCVLLDGAIVLLLVVSE